jgi:hypothetical protein
VPVTLELAKVQYDCVKEVKNIAALCGYVEAKEVKYFFFTIFHLPKSLSDLDFMK